MNNVIALRSSVVDQQSSVLDFHAYERNCFFMGKDDTPYDTDSKALVRMIGDAPKCLAVVNKTYKVVQNKELFDAIHCGLSAGLSATEIRTAQIKDRIAYGGRQCFREYIFPDIAIESPERDTIAFRVIIQNGFGTGAIKLYAGAIDFFCTNGLVLGEYTSLYAKHTSGVNISNFEQTVRGAVDLFWKHREFYNELAGKKIISDAEVSKFLEDRFGERLGTKLFAQFLNEAKVRGNTLWALYSALTYYSSHVDATFTLRNTGQDHAAATMMKREHDVKRATGHEGFMLLAA